MFLAANQPKEYALSLTLSVKPWNFLRGFVKTARWYAGWNLSSLENNRDFSAVRKFFLASLVKLSLSVVCMQLKWIALARCWICCNNRAGYSPVVRAFVLNTVAAAEIKRRPHTLSIVAEMPPSRFNSPVHARKIISSAQLSLESLIICTCGSSSLCLASCKL